MCAYRYFCAHISNIEQMQMLVSLNKAVAFYPKGLFEYVLTDREHISYLPLAGMQETGIRSRSFIIGIATSFH